MESKVESIILDQLKDLASQVRELREKDLPKLATDMALVKDRASRSAQLIAGIGAGLSILISAAMALFFNGTK